MCYARYVLCKICAMQGSISWLTYARSSKRTENQKIVNEVVISIKLEMDFHFVAYSACSFEYSYYSFEYSADSIDCIFLIAYS